MSFRSLQRISILVAACAALGLSLSAQKTTKSPNPSSFRGSSGAGCKNNSWSPEVLTFYGDRDIVLKKIGNFDMHLPDRRIYMFVAETSGAAQLYLYERTPDQKFNVWRWKGQSVGELRDKVANSILENKGAACVGEQLKSLVTQELHPENAGSIPAPVSASAAFAHPIREIGSDYVRVTVYLMC